MESILERIERLLIDFIEEWRVFSQMQFGLVKAPEVWLTKHAVMELLCISESTFYRRSATGNWIKAKNGGTWYYLKASLLQ